MTEDTRTRVVAALKTGGETTTRDLAEATGLSYSQVYRALKDLAERGEVTEFGTTEQGAHLFKLEAEPRRRADDGDTDEGEPITSQTLLPPIGLGATMKIVGLALYGEDEEGVVLELEDGERHLRAVLIEEARPTS